MMRTIREDKIGKIILRIVENKDSLIGAIISNGKITKKIEGNDSDVIWAALQNERLKSHPDYFGWDGAINRFRSLFPEGLSSKSYKDHERNYKDAARIKISDLVSENVSASDIPFENVIRAYQATNLLSPYEKMHLKDTLDKASTPAFINAVREFHDTQSQSSLNRLKTILAPNEAAKWTVVTYLPYFWSPAGHMYLKPKVTQDFASRVGHAFADVYSPNLDITVYKSLLDLVDTTRNKLASLGIKDNIDVQSIIWAIGEY